MKKTERELDESKRNFMKKSALAGAGVVATGVVSGEAFATVVPEEKETKQSKGYQLTPHILEYYKSAAS